MTTGNNAAKFLELEDSASRLLDELEQLKTEWRRYDGASASLESVEDKVSGLTTSLEGVSGQLQSLIAGLQEIGLPALLDKLSSLESELADTKKEILVVQKANSESATVLEDMKANIGDQIEAVRASSNERLDALLEFHSKSIFGKLLGKPNRPK